MEFRDPARHATCAAVTMTSEDGWPVPSRETTTPEPRRDDDRNGILDRISGSSVTVASHARVRSAEGAPAVARWTRLTHRLDPIALGATTARGVGPPRVPPRHADERPDAVHRADADMTPPHPSPPARARVCPRGLSSLARLGE